MDINKISKGIELKIIDIESKLEIDLVTEKSKIKYKLKGTVDRIQSENGNIKIIAANINGGEIVSEDNSYITIPFNFKGSKYVKYI